MKNRILLVSIATVLALSMGLAGCVSEEVPEITEYALTVSSTEGGEVTTPGEGTHTYEAGMLVNLAAEPEGGYRFVNWTGDVGAIADVNAPSTAITMNDHYSITANFEEEEAVVFADPNLQAAIREAINVLGRPIYPSDLERLSSLSASEKNIVDLTGLDHCTSLSELQLWDNQISDISPLANLTSLTVLDLSRNQISDISPLASLTSLTHLYLDHNQISDISPLANLTSLAYLHLYDNEISDISPLANLTNLEGLHLQVNQLSDISPLANLTNLWDLRLQNNQISDISPLVDNELLSEGDTVNLSENPLSSDSINLYIPQLEARGVNVHYEV